jgi:hypothetical protein
MGIVVPWFGNISLLTIGNKKSYPAGGAGLQSGVGVARSLSGGFIVMLGKFGFGGSEESGNKKTLFRLGSRAAEILVINGL